jgi:flagellar hook-length control protein FliK
VPSAPSVPPETSAARSLASHRLQGSGGSQQNDPQVFAALLQTAPPAQAPAPAPPPAPASGPPGPPPQSAQQAPPAADSPGQAAKPSAAAAAQPNANAAKARRSSNSAANSGSSSTTSNTATAPQTNASATDTAASAGAADSSEAGAANDATSGTADQSGSSTGKAAAASALEVLKLANADPAASAPATKDAEKHDGKSASGNANTAPNSTQTQPASSVQPVAAAVVVNTPSDAAPAAPSTRTSLDAQPIAGGKTPALSANNQNALTQDAKNGAAAGANAAGQANSHDQSGSGSADSGAAGNAASAPAATDAQQNQAPQRHAQQGQAQTQFDGSAVAAQSQATLQNADPAKTRADIFGSTSTSGAAGLAAGRPGTSAANPNALPNFGLVAANATDNATASAAANAATAGGAAVPVAGLAVAIAARAQAGSNQFDIRLDPPELGRIDVRLSVDRTGQVTSHVTVDRPDTLQLLQNQQSQLQRALEQAGLKTADNGLQFTLRDQSFAGQNGNGGNQDGGGQNTRAQLVIPDSTASPLDTRPIYARWSRSSGLDIRV